MEAEEILYDVQGEEIFSKNEEEEIFNSVAAGKAQSNFCLANGLPEFAPHSGNCFRCGKNIYQLDRFTGFSVRYAASHHITACPHCHYSFCD